MMDEMKTEQVDIRGSLGENAASDDSTFDFFRGYAACLTGEDLWSLVKERVLEDLPFLELFYSKVGHSLRGRDSSWILEASLLIQVLLDELNSLFKEGLNQNDESLHKNSFSLPQRISAAFNMDEGVSWMENAESSAIQSLKNKYGIQKTPPVVQTQLQLVDVQESLRKEDVFETVQDDQESLDPWMKYEEESEIICPHCGDTSFPNNFTLKAHLKTCKPPTVEASKTCPKCHKKFSSTKYLIYRHIKNCQGDNQSTMNEVNGFEIPSFKCDKCSKEYRTFCHFIHHVSVCGTSSSGDKKESVLWKGKNICNKCGKLFNSLEEKREANHYCNPEKHFKCPKCDYQSYYIRRVKDHYEIKHGCERRFCCHTCGKTFAYKTALNTHLKIHAERKHVCSECGKKFVHKTTLDLHLTTHFRKEIPCDKCGKIFPNSTYLNRHIHSQHPSDGVFQKFQCPYCPGAFREKKYTKKHIRMKHLGMSTNI